MDEEDGRVEVVVPDEQLSLAIGRRGQNVRLASQLTGWQIDIMTESQDSERRQREFAERTALFQEALDVDEVIAQLLVTEGFATVEDVAYVEPSEIAAIEGFDEDTAEEIQARARDYLDKEAAEYDAKRRELGVEDGRAGGRGRDPADGGGPRRGRGEDASRISPASCPTTSAATTRPRTASGCAKPASSTTSTCRPRTPRRLIMRARVAAGWIEPEAEIEEELVEEDEALGRGRRGGRSVPKAGLRPHREARR